MSGDTPSDRLRGVLADAAGTSRPRRAEDATDPTVPVAGTAVLLRDDDAAGEAAGIRVLLLERPDRGSFAGAWVFPGGKLEAADVVAPVPGTSSSGGEEAAARRAAARETREETGLELKPDVLVPVSCWDPPPGLALRIRTWVFAGVAPPGEVVPAPAEVERTAWLTPAEALERHGRGELVLYPPTWVTLHHLSSLTTAPGARAADVVDALRMSGLRRFETVARHGDSGPLLLWQEDAEYAGAGATGSARHRLEIGRLPWLYARSD